MNPLEPPSASSGSSEVLGIDWASFVQVVLEATVQAYKILYKESRAKLKWEEDHFTANLEKHIRQLGFRMGLWVVSQSKIYTVEMENGEVTAKQAKILDLRIWGQWENYDQVHFVWECKRIAERHKNKNYDNLIPEYIKEGIFRFIDEEYASEIDDAGMLGYVLAGETEAIVNDINRSMLDPQRIRKLSTSDHLKVANAISSFKNVYLSCHDRASCDRKISLYHLFLPFDFDHKAALATTN